MRKNIVLDNILKESLPFPLFSSDQVLDSGLATSLLEWFRNTTQWRLTETSFYTQYEFSLLDDHLPDSIAPLTSTPLIEEISSRMANAFNTAGLSLVGITAHKLIDDHRMGVHNDFIGKQETHRLIIQINENWTEDNGGYLMTFHSNNPADVAKIIKPLHNTGIGFEISPRSYHAVSSVRGFERYTLVYTFNAMK